MINLQTSRRKRLRLNVIPALFKVPSPPNPSVNGVQLRGGKQMTAPVCTKLQRSQEEVNSVRYSRFSSLQPMDEAERNTEVPMTDVAEDGVQSEESASFRLASRRQNRRWRTVCFLVAGTLVIFAVGCLIGYVTHPKPKLAPVKCDKELDETSSSYVPSSAAELDWKDLIRMLSDKLSTQSFDQTLKAFDLPRRSAGSDEDMDVADRIFEQFKRLKMEPWTNVHYIQLQTPDSERPNRVVFGSDIFQPEGYLCYSATGKVEGKLVYGNYGRQQDLDVLQNNNIELKDSVLLLRAGRISFAEQVNNTATRGVSAVLIYPDPQDYNYNYNTKTALYGHVHLGSGDPYTPGFPSFNHTQFPPTKSPGLPTIPAQTITADMATTLLLKIGGPEADPSFKGGIRSLSYKLGGSMNITVEVNNVQVTKAINNVFGVIKGFKDPDRYVVLGAQRDAWGSGYARATVGTSILVELAKAFFDMVERGGFRPRRSLVFASWSAGVYGSVGATEWLESYMSSLDKRIVSYISLDGVLMGQGRFGASASPLLYSLIQRTLKEVESPLSPGTLYDMVGNKWKPDMPMAFDDPAYPFLAFSGIPSISFRFMSTDTESYPYFGTNLDNRDHLDYKTNHSITEMTVAAAKFAGQMALRLTHDHRVPLDVSQYNNVVLRAVSKVYSRINQLSQSGHLQGVDPQWIIRARDSFQGAADIIKNTIDSTDFTDDKACRILNDRIVTVEHTLLSPYVSPVETPFRHLLWGRGSHTLAAIAESTDMDHLRTQLALATWTLQECANAMAGDIWDLDNEI